MYLSKLIRQRERQKADIRLYNYALFELNRAKKGHEVNYSWRKQELTKGADFDKSPLNKYQNMAK